MPSESKPTTAERFFTNRENHFTALNKALSNIYNKQYSVLYFYGIGGIGKSRLKRELSKSIKKEQDLIISDSLNFEKSNYRSLDSALYLLYTDLKKYNIDFYAFEIAYAIHWQKLHPQLKLSQSNFPFLEEGSIVSDFVSVLGDIPLVSLLPKVASVFHKLKKGYSEWWTKKGEKELKALETLEVFQIEEWLPYYFALDLKEFYLTTNKKVIFFIDTYEALWSSQDERKNEKFFVRDQWLRSLISYLPNTLWVVFGRERLRWDEIQDDNWSEFIEQHLLGELAFEDANRFLEACNIGDATIRKQIITTSKGLPFYLDLQVETYQKIVNNGLQPHISDLSKSYADILSRFCLYLEPAEIETLKLLSFARTWNYELFQMIIKEFHTGYPSTAFAEILKFSFINYSKENGTYSIHQIMQEHLKETVSPEQKIHIQSFLFLYYENKIYKDSKNLERKNLFFEFNSNILSLIDEAIFQKKSYDTLKNYFEWLLNTSRMLYGETNSNLLLISLENAFEVLEIPQHYRLLIEIRLEISRLYSWRNNFSLIEKTVQEGLNLYDTILKEYYGNDETEIIEKEETLLRVKTDLLIQLASLYNDLDQNIQAYQLYQQAFTEAKKINYYPDKAGYASLLVEIGKIPEAESYFYEQLRKAFDQQDDDLLAISYNRIANIFFLQNLYLESSIYYKKSLDLYLKLKGSDHRYYWISQRKYADSLLELNEIEQAQEILEKTLEWFTNKYGESNADNGYIHISIANCQLKQNDIENGLINIMRGTELIRSKYGFANSKYIEGMILLCECIQSTFSGNLDLKVLSETDQKFVIDIYNKSIEGLEFGFWTNFEGLKMNFGLYSNFLTKYLKVVEEYYVLQGLQDKKNELCKRRIELNRVFKDQFTIRLLDRISEIDSRSDESSKNLEKFNNYLGLDEKMPLAVYSHKLPFYNNTLIYTVVHSDTIKKHFYYVEDRIRFLDWTNSPIYDLNQMDFKLSKETVIDYVIFFFDSVKNSQGKFYVAESKEDIPFRLDKHIDIETRQSISNSIVQLEIIEIDENYITLDGSIFFKHDLFSSRIKVLKNGEIELSNEDIILADIPIAVDPQIESINNSYEDLVTKACFGLFDLLSSFKKDVISEDELQIYNDCIENLGLLKKNVAPISSLQIEKINLSLNNSAYLINKYVRPIYDEYLFEKEIGVFLILISNILAFNHKSS